jgi:iron complex transport system substrate-binding protein
LRRRAQILFAVVAMASAASAQPAVRAPADAAGTGARAPQRIISLVPAVTEMLFVIGAGPRVVAVSSFDRRPETAGLPQVGALLDPDLERILSLTPDLVIVYGTQQDLKVQLARAGAPMFEYEHKGLPDITQTIRTLGARVGAGEESARVAGGIERRLEAVRRSTRGRARPRTLLVFGREPGALRGIYASGGVGFLHDLLELAGGANVFADIRRQSVQATTELILTRAPEVVVELHYAGSLTPDQLAREASVWNTLASVPAVRNRRVHLLVGDELVVPGPRIANAAERLARALRIED